MGREAKARSRAQANINATKERFFYHSFPRRLDGSSKAGLNVLRSMAINGFLLVPEIVKWQEPLANGQLSEPFCVAQKRICFTELSPAELPEHARRFGPFSLEYSIRSLRQLGAIPVFYVPRATTDEHLESVGNAMMARMLEIEQLIDRLAQIETSVRSDSGADETITITVNGRSVGILPVNVGQMRELLDVLFHGAQPASALLAAMRASAGFLYPTEDLQYTETLGYYRQREWRIVSAMQHRGETLSRNLTGEEVRELVEFDAEFFGKELEFRTGRYTRAAQSQFMQQVSGRHVLAYARRLICPHGAAPEARKVLENSVIDLEVIGV